MSIQVISSNKSSSSTGNAISVTHGFALQEDDVVLALIYLNGTTGLTATDNNGATPFDRDYTEGGSSPTAVREVWTRKCGASEPSSFNFTRPTSDRWSIIVYQLRFVDLTQIFDIHPSVGSFRASSGNPWKALTINTQTDNALAVAWWHADSDVGGAVTNPTNGFGNLVNIDVDMTQCSVVKSVTTTGEVGDADVTSALGGGYISQQFSLKAAPPPNQPPSADDDSFTISTNAQVGDVVGTVPVSDSDGTITSASITGTNFDIDTSGEITVISTVGLSVGTITEDVTFTDNDAASTVIEVTINVTLPAISITSVSTTSAKAGATVTVNLQDASVSGKVLSCPAGFITPVSQNATSLVFNTPEPKTFGTRVLSYNEAITFSITDGTDIVSFTLTIEPEVGYDFDTIAELSGIFADDVGLTIGSQAYGHFKKGSGTAVLTQGLISPNTIAQYEYWLRDVADGVWSNSSAIELFEDPTKTKVTIANPVATDGSVLFGYTGSAPVDGDFILHDPVTSPSSIPITVLPSGVWILDSMPTTNQTFDVYVSNATGDVGDIATFTYTAPVVSDTTVPVITLIGNSTVSVVQNTTYTDAGANVTDNVDADSILVGSGSVDTSTIGSYTITYNYQDAAGNVADTVTRTVNVVAAADTQIPVITLIGNSTDSVAQNGTYTDQGANVTDNVDANSVIYGTGTVDTSTVGNYTLTYNYTDAAGNVANTIVRTVNVIGVGTYTVSGTLVDASGNSVPDMSGLSMTLYPSAQDLHSNTNAIETIVNISVTSGSFTATATTAVGIVYMKLFDPGDYSSHASGQIVSA